MVEQGMTNSSTGHIHARSVSLVENRQIPPKASTEACPQRIPPTKGSARRAFPTLDARSYLLFPGSTYESGFECWAWYSKLLTFPTLNPWTRSQIMDLAL